MNATNAAPQDADRYWDYLMGADSSPVTFMLVAVPAIIGISIVCIAGIARLLRRKKEREWLERETEDVAPVAEKDVPHGS